MLRTCKNFSKQKNNPSALKKKHAHLAYHFCREQHLSGVAGIRKSHTKSNLSYGLTKALDLGSHSRCFGTFMVN